MLRLLCSFARLLACSLLLCVPYAALYTVCYIHACYLLIAVYIVR